MSQHAKMRILKLRIVMTYAALNGTLTVAALAWWVLLAWDWFRTREGALTMGLVALGTALNSALVAWLTDWCLGWGGDDDEDDDEDDWEDPEPFVMPPLETFKGEGR